MYSKYARNNRIYFYGYVLIATLVGPTRILHSTNSETGIQWCPLKYSSRFKIAPQCKDTYKLQAFANIAILER